MPLLAQAYGNLFVPALLLVFGLGVMLYSAGRRDDGSRDADSSRPAHVEYHEISRSSTAVNRV